MPFDPFIVVAGLAGDFMLCLSSFVAVVSFLGEYCECGVLC
jgi:hypothetical protein